MIKVYPNDKDPLIAMKVGTGDHYEYIKIRGDGKDKKTMTLWVRNRPSGIAKGGAFRVKEIHGCKYKSVPDQRPDHEGNWLEEFSLDVTVEKAAGIPKGYRPPEWTKEKADQAREEARAAFEVHEDDEGLPF